MQTWEFRLKKIRLNEIIKIESQSDRISVLNQRDTREIASLFPSGHSLFFLKVPTSLFLQDTKRDVTTNQGGFQAKKMSSQNESFLKNIFLELHISRTMRILSLLFKPLSLYYLIGVAQANYILLYFQNCNEETWTKLY